MNINENQLRSVIEQIVSEMKGINAGETLTNTCEEKADSACSAEDITAYDMEDFLRVPSPENEDAYTRYKKNTPARVGIWRAGPRYTTETALRFRADHAVAQDAVFSDVSEEYLQEKGWPILKTQVADKDEYLTRPDLGRLLDDASVKALKALQESKPQVQIYIADGLSSIAIETNAYDTYRAIEQGIKGYGLTIGTPFFVKYGRVPSMDHVSEITKADVTVVLIGERPGLATGESMSCYMIYQGRVGNKESLRTVISNIHKNGTPAVEAGAHIADVIKKIYDMKKSGVDLKL